MKKKDFVRLVLGVVGALLFSVGLCMCLLPEWDAFREGVAVTAAGGAVLLILAGHTALVSIPAFLIRAKARRKEKPQ